MGIASYAEWKSLLGRVPTGGFWSFGYGNGAYGSGTYLTAAGRLTTGYPATTQVHNHLSNYAMLTTPRLPGTSAKKLWIAELEYGVTTSSGAVVGIPRSGSLIYDLLVQTLNFSTNVTGDVVGANLPTPPLTRYTDGVGVQAWGWVATYSMGGTAVVMTITYTNQNGVSGRISQGVLVGGGYSSVSAGGAAFPICLADGDTGIRSVEAVTMSAPVTGNISIMLIKILGYSPMDNLAQIERNHVKNLLPGGAIMEIMPDACVQMFTTIGSTQTGSQYNMGKITIVEA